MIKILQGSCLDKLKELPDQSINTCITSPPYWGLRDYGTAEWEGGNPNCDHINANKIGGQGIKSKKQHTSIGTQNFQHQKVCSKCGAVRKDKQLGMEDTPEEFVDNLVKVFREVKRVLRDDGTVWLNLGDSYNTTQAGNKTWGSGVGANKHYEKGSIQKKRNIIADLKKKDLVGIPWRVAFALQQDGWYLRQDIIWHKPNPMPESIKDRCTKAHEYIFLLSKNHKYYFDNESIKEDSKTEGSVHVHKDGNKAEEYVKQGLVTRPAKTYVTPAKRNKRSVWTVTTKPFKGAHFATFPMDLIEPCVLAGCPEKVCVACGTPYINKPNYEYDNNISKKNNTYGKYGDQKTESANRQGLHADRGNKLIEVRDNLPKQSTLVNFLKSRTKAKILAENTNIPLTKIEHWFRTDESGFAYPSINDWKKVREFIDDYSNEFAEIDNALTDYELKTDSVASKKVIGHELKKQCNCKTNETKPGTVLDPFGGSGTTGIVASNHNRKAVLIELNSEYIEIARQRIQDQGGLFTDLEIVNGDSKVLNGDSKV